MGEKKSSHAITEEYAKADPVYVEKTRVSTAFDHGGHEMLTCDSGYRRRIAIIDLY